MPITQPRTEKGPYSLVIVCYCFSSVPWNMERCCHFVDDLCRHEDLGVVFPSSVSLIPPGVSAASGNMGVVSAIKDSALGKDGADDRPKK